MAENGRVSLVAHTMLGVVGSGDDNDNDNDSSSVLIVNWLETVTWWKPGFEARDPIVHLRHRAGQLTGQVPPVMMRSNDKASGIPEIIPELREVMDPSSMDFVFSDLLMDARAESM